MRKLDLDKLSEHIDYKLIPTEIEGSQHWDVFILRAPFDGTTIRYGNISFDGATQEIKFNFDVVTATDPDILSDGVNNVELQELAADILTDILEAAVKEGTMVA